MGDLIYIIQWWATLFLIGLIFLPFTYSVFNRLTDYGYSFSKVFGLAFLAYASFLLATLRIVPFSLISLIFILALFSVINLILLKRKNTYDKIFKNWKLFLFEEVIFFIGIAFWSYIRAHQPEIYGLEKYMDFGFLNSILRSEYLPAKDMWFTPFSINYYYFGHFTTAVITKLSFIPSFITYNLMIATLFAFTFVLSFSVVFNLVKDTSNKRQAIAIGILGGMLVSLSGNLHTIYSFFVSYNVDNPVPFWNLSLSIINFPNGYWYPNATRFIPFTIHEFPLYSFVVSDLHGHVIDIMYVLTCIALIYVFFITKSSSKYILILIAFVISIMYMTNAWDGLIYMLLAGVAISIKNITYIKFSKYKTKRNSPSLLTTIRSAQNFKNYLLETIKNMSLIVIFFVAFSMPFNIFFKPFASGVGVICAPDFLIQIQRLGPLIFEADHCQTTPLWQFIILYGFFYFFVISFLIFIFRKVSVITKQDIFVLILILVSSLLILIPEFIYVKDIYPAHYRANTMFKLVYQSFIMLSLTSAYVLIRLISSTKSFYFYFVSFVLLAGVLLYPYFAITSYYGELKNYRGLNGMDYLSNRYQDDYNAIKWLNENIKGQPVIVEAQGDSYTDYGRVSTNTGLPTILGWVVHEWLWRGTYDIPAPRIEEVRIIYENNNLNIVKSILNKYSAEYIFIGSLEREKYLLLNEDKFENIGSVIFESGGTKIYKIF